MSPPTKDAFEGLVKMYKSSSEWYAKEAVFESLSLIVKSKCLNFDQISADLMKFILKTFSDKSDEVRISILKLASDCLKIK